MHEKRNIFHAINTNSSQMQALFYGGMFNALDDEHDNAINASVPPDVVTQSVPLLKIFVITEKSLAINVTSAELAEGKLVYCVTVL